MEAFRVLIVDDEQHCRLNLSELIATYCPELEVVALAANAAQALSSIEEYDPQVIFLDVRMPGKDGFELLAEIGETKASIVFTTAHNEYALRALRQGAIDYLEKPIDIDDLERCAQRIKERGTDAPPVDMMSAILKLSNIRDMDRTTIPTSDGFVIVKSSDIVRLEASDSYTRIICSNGDRHMSSKNIRVFEDSLNPQIFFRTHKSHIVNMMYHLTGFSRTDGNVALLSTGDRIPVSRRKLTGFIQRASA